MKSYMMKMMTMGIMLALGMGAAMAMADYMMSGKSGMDMDKMHMKQMGMYDDMKKHNLFEMRENGKISHESHDKLMNMRNNMKMHHDKYMMVRDRMMDEKDTASMTKKANMATDMMEHHKAAADTHQQFMDHLNAHGAADLK